MKTYPTYKDSGVDWLGEIPAHWELRRLGSKFIERKSKVSDKDYLPLSVTKQGILPRLENAAKTKDGDNRKLVKKGDFVINSRSDRKGSSGVAYTDGSVSLINIVIEPNDILRQFCNYFLKSRAFVEENYRIGHGIVADLWTTRYDEMKNIIMAFPPKPEQRVIANFLDETCSKLDAVVAQKEKMIVLLKERKQALIQKAVTRGLEEHVALKDSGVEWIGEVPVGWEVKRLKFVSEIRNDKLYAKESILPYLGMENVESWSGEFVETESESDGLANMYKVGDVLFGKLRPYLAKVYLAKQDGLCSSEFLPFITSNNLLNKFLKNVILSFRFINQINSSTYGSKMPRANPDYIKNTLIPIPPKKEQQKIVDYIDTQAQKLDQAVKQQEQAIIKLKEYKASLVDSCVLGKIKVC